MQDTEKVTQVNYGHSREDHSNLVSSKQHTQKGNTETPAEKTAQGLENPVRYNKDVLIPWETIEQGMRPR